jgi:tetratricopeptide (TPR) repeat protein
MTTSAQLEPADSAKIQDLLTRAVNAHKTARLEEAKQLYIEILSMDVRHAKSLYGLALIAHQGGSLDVATSMMRRAIAADPSDAAFHRALGAVLRDQKKADEALAVYEAVLQLAPNDEESHFNLGDILFAKGDLTEAEQRLKRSLELRADRSASHEILFLVLWRQGRLDEAQASLERALALEWNSAEGLKHMGGRLVKSGASEAAWMCFERALALNPQEAEAHNGLGVLLQQKGKLDEAEASFLRALAWRPEFAQAQCNLGNVALKRRQLAEAKRRYERALAIDPQMAEAHSNLGSILVGEHRFEEARRHYDRALELAPALNDALWNRCTLDLLEGKFEAGWKGYEVRRSMEQIRPRSFPQPIWRGEPLHGARIHLHQEQGIGDTLQFLRYAPLVQALGGVVILDVKPSIVRLAKQLPSVNEVIASGDPLPACEWQCPLMSLPLAFKTSLASIPTQAPYLRAPDEARQKAAKIEFRDASFRVGFVWRGNPEYPDDALRSMALSTFAPLLGVEGVQFCSLQFGAAEQLCELNAGIVDLTSGIVDFADTAAIVERLDLVISVDTAVAHLAGALAKPVWTLLPFTPDWRWMLDHEDSPWYPTMRLFRQPSPGDWTAVIERVGKELKALASGVES